MNKYQQKRVLGLVLIVLSFFLTGNTFSQAPEQINYQSVVRDNSGGVIANQNVGLLFEILQFGPNGPVVYSESHQLTTNNLGLIDTHIGNGIPVSGTMTGVNWGNGPYFLRLSLDPSGGSNFSIMGTSQLVSVPYALFSNLSKSVEGGYDPDTLNEIQIIQLSGDTVSLSHSNYILLYDHPIEMTGTNSLDRQIKLVGDATDTTDVINVQSLQSGRYLFGGATGGNNLYLLNLSPAIQSLQAGTRISFQAGFSNTGPVQLLVNGLGPFPILKRVSSPLDSGDIVVGQILEVVFDGSAFQAGSGGIGDGTGKDRQCFTCDGF